MRRGRGGAGGAKGRAQPGPAPATHSIGMTILPGMPMPDWAQAAPEPDGSAGQPDVAAVSAELAASGLIQSPADQGWSEIVLPSPSQPAEARPTWNLDDSGYTQGGAEVTGSLAGYSVSAGYSLGPGPTAADPIPQFGLVPQYASGPVAAGTPQFEADVQYATTPGYPSASGPVWDVSDEPATAQQYGTAMPFQVDTGAMGGLDQLDWGDWAMVAEPPQPLAPGPVDGASPGFPGPSAAGDSAAAAPRRFGSHARREDVEAFSEPAPPAAVPPAPPVGSMGHQGPLPVSPPQQPQAAPPQPSLADLSADQYLLVARYAHLITGGSPVASTGAGGNPTPPSTAPAALATDQGPNATKVTRRTARRAKKAAAKADAAAAKAESAPNPPARPAMPAPTANTPVQPGPQLTPGNPPPPRSARRRGATRIIVAGVAVVGIGVGGFLAAQYFFGGQEEPAAGEVPVTTLALPAEVAGLTRISGPAAAEAVSSQLGYPLRNSETLGTGAYGKSPQGPGTVSAMLARTAAAPAPEQFANYEARTGNKVGKARTFGDLTCAPVTAKSVAGSLCLWSAPDLRGQTYVVGAKPKAAAGVTAELVAALSSATPTPTA